MKTCRSCAIQTRMVSDEGVENIQYDIVKNIDTFDGFIQELQSVTDIDGKTTFIVWKETGEILGKHDVDVFYIHPNSKGDQQTNGVYSIELLIIYKATNKEIVYKSESSYLRAVNEGVRILSAIVFSKPIVIQKSNNEK